MRRLWSQWRGALSRTKRAPARSGSVGMTTVVESRYDDEQRAAFFDGRLSEDDRAKLMAEVAEDGDAYEVFACTAALLLEGDALLDRMQTPEARAATRRAFDASPDDLRQAAIEAARGSER